VRFAAGILEDGVRLCGCRSPITRATIDKYTEDIAVESIRMQKELGFVPKYDLDAGWRETIQEMREQGIL
jgi:nucleoside-diphosphate-sugar epimerase